jgi:hypothetical protein
MSKLIQACLRFTATAFVVGGILNIAQIAGATPPPPGIDVPEIDPSSAASALAVLAGGGLMLAERFGFRRR